MGHPPLWLIASFTIICRASAQGLDSPAHLHKALTTKRCVQIAASDPKFAPLADACEYALSPNNLPSFVCDESVQQFTSASGPENWQKLADVTAIVTFDHKKEERFSNLSRNGQPIRALSKPHHGQDVDLYFAYNLKSPAPQLSLFGTDLVWVFDARDEADKDLRGEGDFGQRHAAASVAEMCSPQRRSAA